MTHAYIIALLLIILCVEAGAFLPSQRPQNELVLKMTKNAVSSTNPKEAFLGSLDDLNRMNTHDKERTSLLQEMIDTKVEIPLEEYTKSEIRSETHNDVIGTTSSSLSIQDPGALDSMLSVAQGTWKVVYAPHMTIMARTLGGGSLDVSYILQKGGTMISHAVCSNFPFLPWSNVILSVSGTFGTVSNTVCRVDFDRVWVTLNQEEPYKTFKDVPDDASKTVVSVLGQLFCIDAVSIFPLSFLDDNLIVFDFELLGTRICARKIAK